MNNGTTFYICDDCLGFAEKLKKTIDTYSAKDRENEIKVFDSAKALLFAFREKMADAVFLDIDMPQMSGFEAAEALQGIKEDIPIVFVTGYDDKVYQSYEYQPFWFIRKSHIDDVGAILPRLFKKLDAMAEQKRQTVNLKTENSVIEVDIGSLLYIEGMKNNIIIHDRVSGDKTVRCKMGSAEKQLSSHGAARIQRGILVNLRCISKITSREVILTDGTHLGLSRLKAEAVKEQYHDLIRRTLI